MTCRCHLCGKKDSGRLGSRSYAAVGIIPLEQYSKKQDRRLRRRREKKLLTRQGFSW